MIDPVAIGSGWYVNLGRAVVLTSGIPQEYDHLMLLSAQEIHDFDAP
jgi:hypothetical protein